MTALADLDALVRHYDQELARLRARMTELEAQRDQVRREVRAKLMRPKEATDGR